MGQEASALKVGEVFSCQLWNRKYTDPPAGQLGLPGDVLLEESIWLLHKFKCSACTVSAGGCFWFFWVPKPQAWGLPVLELCVGLATRMLLRIALN